MVLFVYNRPVHTQKVLNALAQNELAHQSTIYIYSDGPKELKQDIDSVIEVRNIIRKTYTFNEVIIIESEYNKGLANSIVQGVSSVLETHSSVIILEDDVVTSKWFLTYMNQALRIYEKDLNVMHINGYVPPITQKLPPFFFTRLMQCWGWATWDRAWHKFIADPEFLYSEINLLSKARLFDGNTHGFFLKQLENNISGRRNTWAIKWYASIFLNNGYCLSPMASLTQNIGGDGSGANVKFEEVFDTVVSREKPDLKVSNVEIYDEHERILYGFYRKHNNLFHKIMRVIDATLFR